MERTVLMSNGYRRITKDVNGQFEFWYWDDGNIWSEYGEDGDQEYGGWMPVEIHQCYDEEANNTIFDLKVMVEDAANIYNEIYEAKLVPIKEDKLPPWYVEY